MRMPKCPGIPERIGVEVIDEHQFAARIADDLSRHGSDRSLNLVGSAALPVPLETPTRWGEGPAVRILFPPAASQERTPPSRDRDPDLAFRDFENTSGERLTHPVRILHIGVEGEAVLARVPHADRTARLHEMRIDPADDVAALDDVRCLGEGPLSITARIPDLTFAVSPSPRRPAICRA